MTTARRIDSYNVEPSFYVSEKDNNTIAGKKVGEKTKVIIDFKVIEKTRSFTILKVNYVYVSPSIRRL